jgi:hypothetical protein
MRDPVARVTAFETGYRVELDRARDRGASVTNPAGSVHGTLEKPFVQVA